jgi:LmbE family N-acetylglucosaminyl deacetylase
MAGSPDNDHPECLIQADPKVVAEDIAAWIERLRPQVVVTHDPTGGYFHPDHIRTYEAVNLAFDLADQREQAWRPQRLFYTVIPRKFIRGAMWIIRLSGKNPKRFGENGDIDLSQLGEPEEGIHLRLDVSEHYATKAAASACHVSQGGGGLARFIPAVLRKRMTRFENFALARPEASPGTRVEGFFEGLE